MKKLIISLAYNILIMVCFAYGFQSGMEWDRIVAVLFGGFLLGFKGID